MRKLFLVVSTLTILAMLASVYIFLNIPPINLDQTIDIKNVVVFLGLIQITLTGLITLTVYYFKRIFHRFQPNNLQYKESLRQGFLASIGVVAILILSITEIANTATIILCVIAIISIEWYFQSQKKD